MLRLDDDTAVRRSSPARTAATTRCSTSGCSCSPHRLERPWQGQVEKAQPSALPAYDPACYLCPGNLRANGERNPAYAATFAFDNDFPALLPERRAPAPAGTACSWPSRQPAAAASSASRRATT